VPVALIGLRELLPVGTIHLKAAGCCSHRRPDPNEGLGAPTGRNSPCASIAKSPRCWNASLIALRATLRPYESCDRWSALACILLPLCLRAASHDQWLKINSANFELYTTATERSGP